MGLGLADGAGQRRPQDSSFVWSGLGWGERIRERGMAHCQRVTAAQHHWLAGGGRGGEGLKAARTSIERGRLLARMQAPAAETLSRINGSLSPPAHCPKRLSVRLCVAAGASSNSVERMPEGRCSGAAVQRCSECSVCVCVCAARKRGPATATASSGSVSLATLRTRTCLPACLSVCLPACLTPPARPNVSCPSTYRRCSK